MQSTVKPFGVDVSYISSVRHQLNVSGDSFELTPTGCKNSVNNAQLQKEEFIRRMLLAHGYLENVIEQHRWQRKSYEKTVTVEKNPFLLPYHLRATVCLTKSVKIRNRLSDTRNQ